MNIQAEKLELIRMLLNTKEPSVLASIRRIFEKQEKADFWTTLSEEVKEDIRQRIDELDKGEKYPYNEIISKHINV
jgi:flagellar basal body-associated protein FliL